MNISSFGEITPDSLLQKGGSKLGTLLKQDIFQAPNLAQAMKLYDIIYQKVDNIYFKANHASSTDDAGEYNVQSLRDACNDFFNLMSRNDVFVKIWNLDQDRGKNALFRNIGYNKANKIFPAMIRFFDLFHGSDFTDARMRVNDAANSKSLEDFIASSITAVPSEQDKLLYSKQRIHYIAKFRGLKKPIKKAPTPPLPQTKGSNSSPNKNSKNEASGNTKITLSPKPNNHSPKKT